MNKSPLLTLNWRDAIRGTLLAAITMIIGIVYKMIEAGAFPADWDTWNGILISSAGAGLSYLLKNFMTNSDDKVLKKEEPRYPN